MQSCLLIFFIFYFYFLNNEKDKALFGSRILQLFRRFSLNLGSFLFNSVAEKICSSSFSEPPIQLQSAKQNRLRKHNLLIAPNNTVKNANANTLV
jgi:hypothetical protein